VGEKRPLRKDSVASLHASGNSPGDRESSRVVTDSWAEVLCQPV
jgi:hypothetical protein